MMSSMRIGSMIWRRLAAGAVPAAFAATLPLVQWCPLPSGVSLLTCLQGGVWAGSGETARAQPACTGDHGGCAGHDPAQAGCPFERSESRTLCIGDPMGGPGVRPHSIQVHTPEPHVPLATVEPLPAEPPGERWPVGASMEARPPTRDVARRPPVRGPPLA
jgi:hypothetical protein